MTTQTAMMATLIVILGAAQYALCVQAIHDLRLRPRVRGENKVLWALFILCVPIAGAIVYNWMGPTSFIHRPPMSQSRTPAQPDGDVDPYPLYAPTSNVTPIGAARSARRRRVTPVSEPTRSRPARRTSGHITRVGRTGS